MRPPSVLLFALLSSIATSGEDAQPPVQAEVPPAPQPAAVRRYVTASSLNLRSEPVPTGAIQAKLPINTEVRQDEVRGEWARVTTPQGQGGWVGAAFLGETKLVFDEALRTGRQATDPEERLAWAQRAAALHPIDPDALGFLRSCYAAVGRDADAAKVVARLEELKGSRFEAWFPSAVRTELAALDKELEGVTTVEQFVAARKHAVEVSRLTSEVLGGIYDDETRTFAGESEIDWLEPLLPGLQLQWAPEGLGVSTVLGIEPWAAAAARTPSPDDDRFVAYLGRQYGNLDGTGWAVWEDRDWDYGGCNPFGSGVHHELLRMSGPIRTSTVFGTEVTELRGRLVRSITVDDTEFFPFCTGMGTPNARAVLQAELDAILADADAADLSADERTALEARNQAGWPHNP